MSNAKHFKLIALFVFILLFSIFFGEYININVKSFIYSLSLSIKEFLLFVLPLVIFSLVYQSTNKLGSKAMEYVAIIVLLVCLSNFANTIISYITSLNLKSFGMMSEIVAYSQHEAQNQMISMFNFKLPNIISNDIALLFGVIIGFASSFSNNKNLDHLNKACDYVQKYFFMILKFIMPIFIFGSTLKLQHDGMLNIICSSYLPILFIFVFIAYGIVLLQLMIMSNFNLNTFSYYIKNIFPSVVVGFGSMSSAVAMPLLIEGAMHNCKNQDNASIIIPASVNIHLVGDCIFIPMIAITIMNSFGMNIPDVSRYLIFALHFVLAKFAVAAIPGGGILVMLPILEKYLGFNGEMLGLITAIYILFDPLITACNIMGNGSLGMIFDRIFQKKLIYRYFAMRMHSI